MNKIYSNLLGINSAKFVGCCSNSIGLTFIYSRAVYEGQYISDHECCEWEGDGGGSGYGWRWGNGLGCGDYGEEPADWERENGNGETSDYLIRCNVGTEVLIKEQELLFIERSFDD